MGFEIFQKVSASATRAPSVTIQRRGFIGMNHSAYELLGSPKAVVLLWDKDRRRIGFEPADVADPNGHTVRPASGKSKGGSMVVAAQQFTNFIGLDTSEGRRWSPTMEGDLLVVDLNQPGVPVRSNRTDSEEQNVGPAASATGPA